MAEYYYGGANLSPDPNQPQKPDNGDFISWGLIVVFFITGLWPVGLVLLLVKLFGSDGKKKAGFSTPKVSASASNEPEKAGQNSRAAQTVKKVTQTPQYGDKGIRVMRIVGIVLSILGAVAMLGGLSEVANYSDLWRFAISELSFGFGVLAGGLGLLAGSASMRRRSRRFAKYMAAAGKKEKIPVQFLADAAEVSESKAERDLEIMVEKGMWGPEAYVDNTRDILFRTQQAASAYFDDRRRQSAPPPQAEEGYSGMLRNIRRANDRIADPELSAKIDRLEEIAARIFRAVEESPAKKEKASTFLHYYLPTTQKLLDSYADFEEAGVSGANLSQAKARIEKTMDNIVSGFARQLDELYQVDAMDVDSDIRVMETMLRRDNGSAAEDFGLGGGTAVQDWEEE
ncbi:MAG: 5-bromo-4-chloroindolyl phosphate hydrolysis family protein [Oscillospiraceae bacterium]|nr:5-bromo-4-chloroindolyl phosphate hydrolysis family protein [Oscillospiraceae bacterium]